MVLLEMRPAVVVLLRARDELGKAVACLLISAPSPRPTAICRARNLEAILFTHELEHYRTRREEQTNTPKQAPGGRRSHYLRVGNAAL